MIVVIPTCRSINLERLRPLIDFGARFIIVDDSEGSIQLDHPRFEVYNWRDRSRLLGPDEIAIPRRNGACRDLGFYLAWKDGEAGEIVIALDDDCVVEAPDFPQRVMAGLGHGARRISSGSGRHMNSFDLYRGLDTTRLFPRGFPWSERVSYQPWTFEPGVETQVHFNLGLWQGVLDIAAVDRIRMNANHFPDLELRHENVVVPKGALVSVCAGNLHFRKELIPALYQLPMNLEIMPGYTVNRYGDIWAGFILKRLMDIRGDCMSVGGPMVRHDREGPWLENIAAEHLASLVNQEFIDLIVGITERIAPADYLDMMLNLHEELKGEAARTSPILRAYLSRLDPSLAAWLRALRR